MSLEKLKPSIRGNAVRKGDKWGWKVTVQMEADVHIAHLPAVDGEMVLAPPSMVIDSPEEFNTKEEAIASLQKHGTEIGKMVCKTLEDNGVPVGYILDRKTGEMRTKL